MLPKYQTAILIHGCFWNRHTCANGRVMPFTRREFWENKLNGNAERDKVNRTKLRALGWRMITVWECEIDPLHLDKLAAEIERPAQKATRLRAAKPLRLVGAAESP